MSFRRRVRGGATKLRRALRRPVQARAFDADYYLEHNPDVAQTLGRSGALEHYLRHGWREGRRPNSWFDPLRYVIENGDALGEHTEPLGHFLRTGGRRPADEVDVPSRGGPPPTDDDLVARQVELVREQFDAAFYATEYGDDLPIGTTDHLRHYLTVGWREGRNPTSTFDTRKYLEDYTDVAAAGINPFVHFWEYGLEEGRRLRRTKHPEMDRLDLAVPPRELALLWRRGASREAALSASDLRESLGALRSSPRTVLSLSHDDYVTNVGGVQQLLTREEHDLAGAGIRYLHLSPSVPLLMLADVDDLQARRLHLRLDGEAVGVASADDLGLVLAELAGQGVAIDAVVHQLLGYAPEIVTSLLKSAAVTQPLLWVHDYTSLCSSYALLRNMVEFCGAPPLTSTACMICCHGAERAGHTARVAAFHRAHEPVVLAPSRFAAEMWDRAGMARSALVVEPLAELVDDPGIGPRAPREGPLRVAHLGARTYLKGWHVFAALAEHFDEDARYEFLQLGLSGDMSPSRSVRTVAVRPGVVGRNAMINALQEHGIDVIVNWSLAAETFSFTTYEAMAAGAFVVTRLGSGNVWPAVVEHGAGRGAACPDTAALYGLFAGDAVAAAASSPVARRRLAPRDPSAAHLLSRRGTGDQGGSPADG